MLTLSPGSVFGTVMYSAAFRKEKLSIHHATNIGVLRDISDQVKSKELLLLTEQRLGMSSHVDYGPTITKSN